MGARHGCRQAWLIDIIFCVAQPSAWLQAFGVAAACSSVFRFNSSSKHARFGHKVFSIEAVV